MLFEENFDADEILREPGDEIFPNENENKEESENIVSELDFGTNRSMESLDIPPEEEADLW